MEFDKHNLKWRCKSKGQGQGLARYQESLQRRKSGKASQESEDWTKIWKESEETMKQGEEHHR